MQSSTLNSTLPDLQSIFDPSHPLAYLAYLPPSLAYELLTASYVVAASLAIHIWDILSSLNADFQVLSKRPLGLPYFVYWLSRLSTLSFILFAAIYETAPVGNCETLSRVGPCLFSLAVASTSLLFYLRLIAVYCYARYIYIFFFLMWLAVVGGSITTVAGVQGVTIGPTNHCLSGPFKSFIGANVFIPFLNDTLIFVAIWFRMVQIGLDPNAKAMDVIKVIITGGKRNDLRRTVFMKAMFRDGQAYYLSTAGLYLMAMVIFYVDSIPVVYRILFPTVNLTVINIMACRVYRRGRMGKYQTEGSMIVLADDRLNAGDLPTEIPMSWPARVSSSAMDTSQSTVWEVDLPSIPAPLVHHPSQMDDQIVIGYLNSPKTF